MKTLTALLATLALSTSCGKDAPQEAPPPAPAPAPVERPAPPPAQPAPPAEPSKPTKLGASGLPVECDDYKAAIDKLTKCDKLAPEAKDSIVQAYQAASGGWAKLPEDSRRNLAATCKAAVESVNAAAKTQCGW
jgi:hypothetical protein